MRELRILPILAAALLAACSSSSSPNDPAAGTPGPAGTATGTKPGGPTTPPADAPPAGTTPFTDPLTDSAAKACTGAAGSLYALSAKRLTVGDDIPLCRLEGRVVLLVNTASKCGNTPQYKPLEAVYEQYRTQGLTILGFPSPQFGGQEFATDKEVTAFCTSEYKITFPMFTIGDVNGANKQPVYAWIHSQPGGPAAPNGYDRDVQWNFEKYLVDRKGKIVLRIENGTYPDSPEVIAAIVAELAKP